MIAITKALFEYQGVPKAGFQWAKQPDTGYWKQVPIATTGDARVEPAANVAPVQKVVQKVAAPGSQDNMRQTFNSFPDRGRSLRIAGKGQPGAVNPEHQAQFDARFKQVVAANADRNPAAGVPAIQKVVAAPQEISGPEAVKIALTKGAKATGEAISTGAQAAGKAVASGVKGAAEHVAEHPVAAALTAGAGAAAGAFGLRKIINRNKQA